MLPYRFNKGQHMTQNPTPQTTTHNTEFGRVSDIANELRVSVNTIWRLARNHDKTKFPKPVKLSERVTAWKGEDVLSWLESKEAA